MELTINNQPEDILSNFKNRRFLVVENFQSDDDLFNRSDLFVVLCDIEFWAREADNLIEWCIVNNLKQRGMTVEFQNNEQLTMFILRWS